MRDSIQIGRLAGIPVRLHITFLFIIPVFTYIIGSEIGYTFELLTELFRTGEFDTSLITAGAMPYLLGLFVTLSLFISVLFHETAHGIAALREGLKIKSITLLLLGGIADIAGPAVIKPKTELKISAAGPAASLLFGVICAAAAYCVPRFSGYTAGDAVFFYAFGYLGLLSLLIFLFNIIPAFPMDGGRILRSLLAFKMPYPRATSIATKAGKIFAVLFGIAAVLTLNMLLLLIAVFIFLGAMEENSGHDILNDIKDSKASDALETALYVNASLPLNEYAKFLMENKSIGSLVVNDEMHVCGVASVKAMSKVPPEESAEKCVSDIMSNKFAAVTQDESLDKILTVMIETDSSLIPVIEGTEIIGIITRGGIFKYADSLKKYDVKGN